MNGQNDTTASEVQARNMTKRSGLVKVHVLYGGRVTAELYEPAHVMNTHHTITSNINLTTGLAHYCSHEAVKWYGQVGTRLLPADIEKLPIGDAWTASVQGHRWHQICVIAEAVAGTVKTHMSKHCTFAAAVRDGYAYTWQDQAFADLIRSMDSENTVFAVEWME